MAKRDIHHKISQLKNQSIEDTKDGEIILTERYGKKDQKIYPVNFCYSRLLLGAKNNQKKTK